MFQGMAQRKCQTFEGYTLCAKYNPSARQYRINVDVGTGRLQKSSNQQSRQNIQQYAAKQLTDTNVLNEDGFVYDDDDDDDRIDDSNMDEMEYSQADDVQLRDCLVITFSFLSYF